MGKSFLSENKKRTLSLSSHTEGEEESHEQNNSDR
jgi:hypothetical protein